MFVILLLLHRARSWTNLDCSGISWIGRDSGVLSAGVAAGAQVPRRACHRLDPWRLALQHARGRHPLQQRDPDPRAVAHLHRRTAVIR